MAVGRKATTHNLNLKQLGIKTDEDGKILTNKK
jgi:pyruvate/2-oxoglutarate dehydrogenase complex dihydrolipoamide dehydrogenase (E3) component